MRQAFDDGRLADARFAQQHGVVLLAARENLNDALDLVGAADDGVELALAGQFGEVASEAVECGRFGLVASGALAGAAASFAATAAAGFAFVRHVVPQQVQDFFAHVFQFESQVHQNLGSHAFLFAEQPEKQVFGADVIVREVAGFLDRILDHLLGPRRMRKATHHDLLAARTVLNDLLHFQANLAQVDVEVLENVGGHTRAFLHETEQNVLGPDVLVVEPLSFLVGQLHDLPGSVGEAFIHRGRLPGTDSPTEASYAVERWVPTAPFAHLPLPSSRVGGRPRAKGFRMRELAELSTWPSGESSASAKRSAGFGTAEVLPK